ncbi:hypothetical protein Hanom_Chr13g01204831 [Helianthus anomalus]
MRTTTPATSRICSLKKQVSSRSTFAFILAWVNVIWLYVFYMSEKLVGGMLGLVLLTYIYVILAHLRYLIIVHDGLIFLTKLCVVPQTWFCTGINSFRLGC